MLLHCAKIACSKSRKKNRIPHSLNTRTTGRHCWLVSLLTLNQVNTWINCLSSDTWNCRRVYGILPNIYVGAFSQKQLMAFNHELFPQKTPALMFNKDLSTPLRWTLLAKGLRLFSNFWWNEQWW